MPDGKARRLGLSQGLKAASPRASPGECDSIISSECSPTYPSQLYRARSEGDRPHPAVVIHNFDAVLEASAYGAMKH